MNFSDLFLSWISIYSDLSIKCRLNWSISTKVELSPFLSPLHCESSYILIILHLKLNDPVISIVIVVELHAEELHE